MAAGTGQAEIFQCLESNAFQPGFGERDLQKEMGTCMAAGGGLGAQPLRRAQGQAGATPAWAGRKLMATARGAESWGIAALTPSLGVPSLELPCSPLSNRPPQGTPGSSPAPSQLCPSHQCQPERMRHHCRVGWRGRTRSWSGKGLLTAASSPRRNRDLSSQEPQPVGQGS